jgi:hypothetical protein
MLTVEKLRVYESYGGDIDGWASCKASGNAGVMTDDDWYLIEELRQGLALVTAGATKEFTELLENRLKAVTVDEATRQVLKALVGQNG